MLMGYMIALIYLKGTEKTKDSYKKKNGKTSMTIAIINKKKITNK